MSRKDREEFENISDEELEKIECMLNEYSVPQPQEIHINETINSLRQYVPKKKSKLNIISDRYGLLLNRALQEVSFMNKIYFIVTAILYFLGFAYINYFKENMLTAVFILSPIPFIIGIIEVCREKDKGMIEIEMTCKYSFKEVLLSRFNVILVYNMAANIILSLIVHRYDVNYALWQINILWLLPLLFLGVVTLFLSKFIKNIYAVVLASGIWIVTLVVSTSIIEKNNNLGELIDSVLSIKISIIISLCLICYALMIFQIKDLGKEGENIGFSH